MCYLCLPAVSGEVIVCDTSPTRALLIRDIGRHQSAAVEPYVANRVPVYRQNNYVAAMQFCF